MSVTPGKFKVLLPLLVVAALYLPLRVCTATEDNLKELLVDTAFDLGLSLLNVNGRSQGETAYLSIDSCDGIINVTTYLTETAATKAFSGTGVAKRKFRGYPALENDGDETALSTFAWLAGQRIVSIARADGSARIWAETICSNMLAKGYIPPPIHSKTVSGKKPAEEIVLPEFTPAAVAPPISMNTGTAVILNHRISDGCLRIELTCSKIATNAVVFGKLFDVKTGAKLAVAPKIAQDGKNLIFNFAPPITGWDKEDIRFELSKDGITLAECHFPMDKPPTAADGQQKGTEQ